MYSDKVIEHFQNPHNRRKMENPDAIGKVGNPVCGDVMWIYIQVEQDFTGVPVIDDISWETFGCTAAIATSSMVTDIAKGKTLEEALDIENEQVAEALDGLPPVKVHCSILAADGLAEAIYNYYQDNGIKPSEDLIERHEKIQQEMEDIEEKYSDFAELEEQIHDSQQS